MASIAVDPGGKRRILFHNAAGDRKALYLGKCSQRAAEALKHRVEQLVEAQALKQAMALDLATWVAEIEGPLAKKLANVGLIASREPKPIVTVGGFLTAWLASRADYKPASRRAWRQVTDGMKNHFGGERPLDGITRADAESYRQKMLDAKLRATTIHKRLNHARMIFREAVESGAIAENPFAKVRQRIGDVAERRAYVPAADVLRVLDFLPNTTWKLLLVLSRFAGFRTPSESFSLKLTDVDWERKRITVPVPKLEHLPGRAFRVIPLFPEVEPWLLKAAEEAPQGAIYLVA